MKVTRTTQKTFIMMEMGLEAVLKGLLGEITDPDKPTRSISQLVFEAANADRFRTWGTRDLDDSEIRNVSIWNSFIALEFDLNSDDEILEARTYFRFPGYNSCEDILSTSHKEVDVLDILKILTGVAPHNDEVGWPSITGNGQAELESLNFLFDFVLRGVLTPIHYDRPDHVADLLKMLELSFSSVIFDIQERSECHLKIGNDLVAITFTQQNETSIKAEVEFQLLNKKIEKEAEIAVPAGRPFQAYEHAYKLRPLISDLQEEK